MNSRLRELFVAYLVILLLLTFLPLDGLDNGQPVDLRLGLFRTINFAFRRGLESHQFVVLIGNIAAFVPLGIFVPLRSSSGNSPYRSRSATRIAPLTWTTCSPTFSAR